MAISVRLLAIERLIRTVFCDPSCCLSVLEEKELTKVVERALISLPWNRGEKDSQCWNRQESVLRRRFGLWEDGRGWSVSEIAEYMEVTKERVRQLINNALRRLRKTLLEENIDKFFISPVPPKIMALKSRLSESESPVPAIEEVLREAICRDTIGHPKLRSRVFSALFRENIATVPQLVTFLKSHRKIMGLGRAGTAVLRGASGASQKEAPIFLRV